jgi:hypothetical protein
MSKWTPEPWDDFGGMLIATDESRINIYDNNGNRARIVACINALAGIDDPAAFVERAKRMEEALREIRTGKIQADNEHPLGEYASMGMRFHNIARTALETP